MLQEIRNIGERNVRLTKGMGLMLMGILLSLVGVAGESYHYGVGYATIGIGIALAIAGWIWHTIERRKQTR
jgi:hypothetical protein